MLAVDYAILSPNSQEMQRDGAAIANYASEVNLQTGGSDDGALINSSLMSVNSRGGIIPQHKSRS